MEAKGLLRQAKEDAVQEYHDSNALLKELGGSFANGFDNCFRQVKASFSDLNLSHISIDAQAQTPALPVYSEGIGKLFADETNPNPQADRGATHADQEKSVLFFFSFSFLYIVNFVFLRRQYLFLPSPIVSWFLWM